jgi:hypothetical protein
VAHLRRGEDPLADVDCQRALDRGHADRDVVDEDLGALDVDREGHGADALPELLQSLLHLLASRTLDTSAPLLEVPLVGDQRRGVVLQLPRGLAQIVEDPVVGIELVRALELDERGLEVERLVELHAALKALGRLDRRVGRAGGRSPRLGCDDRGGQADDRDGHTSEESA